MTTSPVRTVVDWSRLLEEAPARVDLPAPRGVETPPVLEARALAAGLDTSGAGAGLTPTETWGVVLAGLLTRYAQAEGPVTVTVSDEGSFTPLTLDLAGDPDHAAAVLAWRDAWAAQHPGALAADELATVAVDHPAAAQVRLRADATPWPDGLSEPALDLDLTAGDPVLLARDGGDAVVTGHLAALVRDWASAVPLSGVALVPADELSRILAEGRGPDLVLGDRTVWALVRETAGRVPGAEALVDRQHRLTYRDLVDRVETVAAALVGAGVARGTLVGLCVDRSVAMVVGMLAVHRCGAAYVPIDPSYPADRIAMMVEDADLGAVLTESGLVEVVDAPGVPRVLLDEDRPAAGDALAGVEAAGPDDRAYVIFTSGSTGRPKGVMIGQRALANFVLSMARTPGVVVGDRLLAVTTLSFDIAGLELLVPLTVGGCVVVADRPTTLDPAALADRLAAERITVMQATPATWRMLVDHGWPGRPGLRVLCGGEALPRSLADAVVPLCAEMWNMYGPTETTIWSMAGRVTRGGGDLTIGDPIHNTVVFVADRWGNAVPDGLAGELLIGGDGVAEGYLGRPDLTAERFLPDRVTGGSGRVYRTGDLVRRGHGGIEFIGRIDGQVKVRGFRIELAEVESALESHPAVARAVAVTRPDPRSGTNRLVAYVVAAGLGLSEGGAGGREGDGGDGLDGTTLRHHVAGLLPDYMVPSVVAVLEEFPLTLNGKIDRKALPDPAPVRVASAQVAARTPLEERLVAIWERVLQVEPIGVTDDVFDLGTDSLTTARLYATVGRELEVELPIAAAFKARTIEAVADLVERLRGGGQVETESLSSLVPIRPQGTARPLFLVHGGAGTVLLYEPLARRLPAAQPVYALQAAGLYGGRAPQSSVTDMASLYLEEVAGVQPHGPYRIGGYCFGALVAFEMARQLEARGETVELLISFNGPSPSYLRRYKPLFDTEGALTNEAGEVVRGRGTRGGSLRPGALARRVRAGEPATAVARGAASLARRKARARARWLYRRGRIRWSLRLDRPLPDGLREAGVFQQIAARAQDAYEPGHVAAGMLVFAGEGLYYREDVGWSDHVGGPVEVVEVAGPQLTPRASMRAEFVGQIVDAVSARLAALT